MNLPSSIPSVPTIIILSGGIGASAEQLVRTVLAQFPEDVAQIATIGNIRRPEQITEVCQKAQEIGALVVYTLVDSQLHNFFVCEARRFQIRSIDLMGPLLEWIVEKTGKESRGQPGLYRQLHQAYFGRVAAIDYAMAHDDGKNPAGWSQAEALLVGVSRVGKTPLSIYLAVLGWKVANYPFVPQVPVPESLFSLDPKRVFGITIEPGQLLQYRLRRQIQLGAPGYSAYIDPESIFEEVQEANRVFRRGRFTVIDMTDKTIELGADEIIRHLS